VTGNGDVPGSNRRAIQRLRLIRLSPRKVPLRHTRSPEPTSSNRGDVDHTQGGQGTGLHVLPRRRFPYMYESLNSGLCARAARQADAMLRPPTSTHPALVDPSLPTRPRAASSRADGCLLLPDSLRRENLTARTPCWRPQCYRTNSAGIRALVTAFRHRLLTACFRTVYLHPSGACARR